MAQVVKKAIRKNTVTRKKVTLKKKVARKESITISNKSNKAINIKILDNSLDVYSSPHLVDLSQVRYIERIKPTAKIFDVGFYNDVPGGELLAKFYVWELLSFENSEILIYFRDIWQKFFLMIRKPFQKIDLTPKLPLFKKERSIDSSGNWLWQEVTIVSLITFIIQSLKEINFYIGQLYKYLKQEYRRIFVNQDEIVNFNLRTIPIIKNDDPIEDFKLSDDLLLQKPAIGSKTKKKNRIKSRFVFKLPIIKLPQIRLPLRQLAKIKFPKINWPVLKIPRLQLTLQPTSFYFKSVLGLALVALLIILPIKAFTYWQSVTVVKGEVLGETEEAMENLKFAQTALFNFDISGASEYFASANENFVSAQNQLADIKSFLTTIAGVLPNSTFKSGKNLLDLGEELSSAGEYLLTGLNQLIAEDDLSLTSRIKNFQIELAYAREKINKAEDNLAKINIAHIPEENRPEFEKLKDKLPLFMTSIEASDEIVDFVINFLGDNDLKRYLVIFQNDNELRATGGFMGSFALVDIQSGEIANIELPKGGTYDLEAGLKDLLEPPSAIALINERWEFQDTNWWPDWPTSAKNITRFYNRSGGPTIDGVIAINSDWLGKILEVTGKIEMPEYQKVITASNFEQELQKSVELEYVNPTEPKVIIGDLASAILEKIFDIEPFDILDLAAAVDQGLKEKDILIYLADENLYQFAMKNNWDGKIKDVPKDYLSVVATNIGGGKTDNNITQKITHQAKISADGSIIDEVLISRYHFGPTDEIFTNISNRSYLRVYVPEGSQLIKAVGFEVPIELDTREIPDYLVVDSSLEKESLALVDEDSQTKIYQENNKTVFANWLKTKPGETDEVLLVYQLPFKINIEPVSTSGLINRIFAAFTPQNNYDSYSLVVQKQSGSNSDEFISTLSYDQKFEINQTYPQLNKEEGRIIFADKIDQDLFYFANLKY